MRSRCAFTLVELLVVIAIMAVLMAMLLPVLKRAKEQAGRVKCTSGARQAELAVESFCSDHTEYFPPGKPPPLPNLAITGYRLFTPSGGYYPFHMQLCDGGYITQAIFTRQGGCPYGPPAFVNGPGSGGEYYTRTDDPYQGTTCGLNPVLQSGYGWIGAPLYYGYTGAMRRSDRRLTHYASVTPVTVCSHVTWEGNSFDAIAPLLHTLGIPTVYLPDPGPPRHSAEGLPILFGDGHGSFMPAAVVQPMLFSNPKGSPYWGFVVKNSAGGSPEVD